MPYCRTRSVDDLIREYATHFLVQTSDFTEDSRPRWQAFRTVTQTHRVAVVRGTPIPTKLIAFPIPERGPGPFPQRITIGRSRTNALRLVHESVSKLHAFLVQTDGGYRIYDAKSRNGTFVNSEPVNSYDHGGDPSALSSGDEIRIGGVCFTFVTAEDLHELLRP